MKKGLRNLIVIALVTILSVAIVYAAYTYYHTHYPTWTVATAIEVQYPVGTIISASSSPTWGTVYVGDNARDYRVINRSGGAISVDISTESAPTNYTLTHNVTSPFQLLNNGDFMDIRFILTVPAAYGSATNNATITFKVTG